MTDASAILVLVETADGQPIPLGHELLGLARSLGDVSGGDVVAVVLGSGLGNLGGDLVARGADRVCLVDDTALGAYQADAWMPDVVAATRSVEPTLVLIGHTSLGADLAPRLAFRLDAAVTTACVDVVAEAGKLLFTRACYGGNAREVASFTTGPVVATIKPKAQQALEPDPTRDGEVVRLASVLEPETVRTRITNQVRDAAEDVPLEAADVIVAGGGGMKGPAGFQVAHTLAALLGGAVGASRVACDLGWCPPSYQIGLSGRTVAPELYVAVGISGAGHHLAGCANAKTIVAINTDADAPIFKAARFGIVGDCHRVMPALIEAIEATRGSRSGA